MQERVFVVTGANSGVGKGLTLRLAETGGTVIMVCRNRERGEAAQAEIRAQSGNQRVDLLIADLSSMAAVRAVGEEIKGRTPQVDLLINNAAVLKPNREHTTEGNEIMFATNHLAPFLLTRLLLESLKASGLGRVLNVTAPSTSKLDFGNLQGERDFNSLNQFGATKMANLLFTFGAARRWQDSGVSVNAIHPGLVQSNLMREANFLMRLLMSLISWTSPARAAESIVRVGTGAEYADQTGKFYLNGKETKADSYAYDQAVQDGLWQVSAVLTQV